jgi:DNA-binding IclR family transcriptional regulator
MSAAPLDRREPSGTRAAAEPPGRRPVTVQSVERAVRLLRAVASASGPETTTVTALAATCGLNRATAWRLLVTLESQGLVVVDAATGRYAIGPGIAYLAGRSRVADLVGAARPALADLMAVTGETAALAVDGPAGLTYVDEVAPAAIVAATWRGRVVPLHATSTGKVLLAYSGDAVRRLAGSDLTAYTPTTVTDADALLAELEATRRRGYAVCRGEYEASAHGVSAPVLDAGGLPAAVLSVWGPADRVTEDRFAALGEQVMSAARRVGLG